MPRPIRRVLPPCVAAALIVFLLPALARAQRPMSGVDLLNIPRVADPQLSPDGRRTVYTVSAADWKSGKRVTHVWMVNIDAGDPVQLTTGAEGENSPRWSPDGRSIAFASKRGENEFAQVYVLRADGGEASQLTSHPSAVSELAWARDGSAIYFVAPDAKTAEDKAKEKAKDDVYAYDENYKQTHLWTVNVATRAETKLTSGSFSISSYALSRDGRKIAFHRKPNPLLGSNDEGEVWIMDADGGHATQLTRNHVPEENAVPSPDGSEVLFIAGANARFEPYYNGRLFVVPASGGTPRAVVGDTTPIAVDEAAWSEDGRSIVFTANLGVHEELFVVPASGGTPRQLTNGAHNITAWSLAGDRIAATMTGPATGGDLWTMTIADLTPKQVTHVSDYLARDFTLGRQETIQWKAPDGTTIEGLLTYPAGYEAGRRYPLVVMTHGGPQSSDKYGVGSWAYELQVFAGMGYACLQPNYRGSTGYGDAFLRDMIGHYFQNAHLDVLAGVDEVIRRGIADPDRLVKMGWSAGGHMTNKIITTTTRFKAAAAGAGAANWISMYAQSDIRYPRTPWFGGTPWQKNAPIDAYWNNSPLKDVAAVTTPTLFFVGEKDPRVPMPQSIEMYHALKANGVPTHLYVAPREPHSWGELRHALFKMNAEIDWFEKYARSRSFTWEKAPEETAPKADGKTSTQPH